MLSWVTSTRRWQLLVWRQTLALGNLIILALSHSTCGPGFLLENEKVSLDQWFSFFKKQKYFV